MERAMYLYNLNDAAKTVTEIKSGLDAARAKLQAETAKLDDDTKRFAYVIDAAFDVEVKAAQLRHVEALAKILADTETEDEMIEMFVDFRENVTRRLTGDSLPDRLDTYGLAKRAEYEGLKKVHDGIANVHRCGERDLTYEEILEAKMRTLTKRRAAHAATKAAEEAAQQSKVSVHRALYGSLEDAAGKRLTTQRVKGALKRAGLADEASTRPLVYRVPGARGEQLVSTVKSVDVYVYRNDEDDAAKVQTVRAALEAAGLFVLEPTINEPRRVLVTGFINE